MQHSDELDTDNLYPKLDETQIKQEKKESKDPLEPIQCPEAQIYEKNTSAYQIYKESTSESDLKVENTNLKKQQKNTKKLFKCSLCPEQFTFLELRNHKRTAHTNIPCDICDEIFEDPFKLNRHKNYKHDEKKIARGKIRKNCEICGKSIIAIVLQRHIRDMHGGYGFWKYLDPNYERKKASSNLSVT